MRYQNGTAPDVMPPFATSRAVQELLSRYVVFAGKLRRRWSDVLLSIVLWFIYSNKAYMDAGLLSRR